MKRTYYKIFSKVDNKLELQKNAGLHSYWYEYKEDGTKFAATESDDLNRLAIKYNGDIYEVHEDRILVHL